MINDPIESKPLLIEPNVKHFITKSLLCCVKIKQKYYSYVYNFMMFVFLCIFFGIILFYKYKGKLTVQEKRQRDETKKNVILSKIHQIKKDNINNNHEMITTIPMWEDDEYTNVTNMYITKT
jgi:hypothetical protein